MLQGAQETIRRYRPALYVDNDRADRSAPVIELIQRLGYDLFWHLPPLFNPDNFARAAENVFGDAASVNMVCFPTEAKANMQGFRRIDFPTDRWNG